MTAVSMGAWRFTLRGTELADLAYDGEPVLRAIRFVTRDHDWRTADDTVLARTLPSGTGSRGRLRIEASARYDDTEVLRYTLEVTVDGPILRVDATGTTTTPFRRNRIGLVVLHPPTLAGVPFTARHPSGSATAAAFPTWIAPHQPAQDLSGLDWSTGRVALTLDLAGDVFETEDQRGWTDASFKTYSTPLSEPFPVALDAGSVVHQSLTLRATTDDRPGGTASPPRTSRSWTGRLPPRWSPRRRRSSCSLPRPRRLRAGAEARPLGVPVLVEPVLGDPNVGAVLASARRDAGGGPLDVRFVTDDPDRLRAAIDDVLAGGPVVRIGAFDPTLHVTTPALQQALLDTAAAAGDLEVVAGTRAHFTELNRTVDLFRDWDGPLTFSVTPQMHDRSPEQVTESIRMQRWVVMSASRLAAGRALHVGPVTLRPRFNAVATSARPVVTDATVEAGYGPQFVADATDPAQHSAAAAAWFRASVRALTVPGVASITLAEAWGPRGGPLPG
ncbi:hypothetical protein QP157_16955 [Sphingomonas sp. LR61]|uniref:hypothetical protein n=1 Tax=Sphingomonas sp. LR61 TaxID=3050234 RepID=UPI002FE0AAE8